MPTFFVPFGVASNTAASGDVPIFGHFVDPVTGLPISAPSADAVSVLQTWLLEGITVPIAVRGVGQAGTAPSVASLTVTANIGGTAVWSEALEVMMAGTSTGFGQDQLGIDFTNALALGPGQKLTFDYSIVFDVAVNAGWQLAISATLVDVTGLGPEPAPVLGPVRYDINYNPALPGRAPR